MSKNVLLLEQTGCFHFNSTIIARGRFGLSENMAAESNAMKNKPIFLKGGLIDRTWRVQTGLEMCSFVHAPPSGSHVVMNAPAVK